MVAKTQFAITGEDTRYFLNGAQFVLRGDSMSLVATDGHRLALVTVKRDGTAKDGEDSKAILPKKTLGELGRLLAEGDGDVSYERGENHMFFDGRRPPADLADDRRTISRPTSGSFRRGTTSTSSSSAIA